MARCFGPFEFWLSPVFSDGWRPRGFYRLKVKRLNHYGPPPHGVSIAWGRAHMVLWYRHRDRRKYDETQRLTLWDRVVSSCPVCEGFGYLPGAHTDRVNPCPSCDGTGRKKEAAGR